MSFNMNFGLSKIHYTFNPPLSTPPSWYHLEDFFLLSCRAKWRDLCNLHESHHCGCARSEYACFHWQSCQRQMHIYLSMWAVNERCLLSYQEVLCSWSQILHCLYHLSWWYHHVWHHQRPSWQSALLEIFGGTCSMSLSSYTILAYLSYRCLSPTHILVYTALSSWTIVTSTRVRKSMCLLKTCIICHPCIVIPILTVDSLQAYLPPFLLSWL